MSLADERCRHATAALRPEEVEALLAELPAWRVADGRLVRAFRFPDYPATLAFVAAVGALAEAEDHHPEMLVGWGRVELRWDTHSVQGLSRNDFICAAKVERLG